MSGGFRVGASSSVPASVRKTIQNIKEIAGNHSDDEIYAMLKECSMDPNETAQKLLFQGSFSLPTKYFGRVTSFLCFPFSLLCRLLILVFAGAKRFEARVQFWGGGCLFQREIRLLWWFSPFFRPGCVKNHLLR